MSHSSLTERGQAPDGGRLSPGQTADLLGCYGILLTGGNDNPATVAARAGGTEVIVRVTADHTFGPLVMFGPGGTGRVPAGLAAGHAARLTPLTDLDADQLIPGAGPGTCPKSPTLTSAPSSPAQTQLSSRPHGSRWHPTSPTTRSFGSCADALVKRVTP
jgi:ATP-grasp domain